MVIAERRESLFQGPEQEWAFFEEIVSTRIGVFKEMIDKVASGGVERKGGVPLIPAIIVRGFPGSGREGIMAAMQRMLQRREIEGIFFDLRKPLEEEIEGPFERLQKLEDSATSWVVFIRMPSVAEMNGENGWVKPVVLDQKLARFLRGGRTGGVVIIESFAGQHYPWRNQNLGSRATLVELSPLDTGETAEILRQFGSPRNPKEVLRITGGHLEAVLRIARGFGDKEALEMALEKIIEEQVPPNEIIMARKYLLPLSILCFFDDGMIPEMFRAAGIKVESWINWGRGGGYYRPAMIGNVLRLLANAGFLTMTTDGRMFVVRPPVRELAENLLRLTNPNFYSSLHQRANELYSELARQYGQMAERLRQIAEHHQKEATGAANQQ